MSQQLIDFVKSHISLARSNAEDPCSFVPHLLIIRDVSASASQEDMVTQALFAGSVADQVDAKITYAAVDTAIRMTTTKDKATALTEAEIDALDNAGGGGSDILKPLADVISAKPHEFTAVLVITDGYIMPVTYEALCHEVIEKSFDNPVIPPIGFAVISNAKYDNLSQVAQFGLDYPKGTFFSDFVVVPTPEVSLDM